MNEDEINTHPPRCNESKILVKNNNAKQKSLGLDIK
jgi:hypothetical protein